MDKGKVSCSRCRRKYQIVLDTCPYCSAKNPLSGVNAITIEEKAGPHSPIDGDYKEIKDYKEQIVRKNEHEKSVAKQVNVEKPVDTRSNPTTVVAQKPHVQQPASANTQPKQQSSQIPRPAVVNARPVENKSIRPDQKPAVRQAEVVRQESSKPVPVKQQPVKETIQAPVQKFEGTTPTPAQIRKPAITNSQGSVKPEISPVRKTVEEPQSVVTDRKEQQNASIVPATENVEAVVNTVENNEVADNIAQNSNIAEDFVDEATDHGVVSNEEASSLSKESKLSANSDEVVDEDDEYVEDGDEEDESDEEVSSDAERKDAPVVDEDELDHETERAYIDWGDEKKDDIDISKAYDKDGNYNPNHDHYYDDAKAIINNELAELLVEKEKTIFKVAIGFVLVAASIVYLVVTL